MWICFVTWRVTGHYFQVYFVFDNFVHQKGLGWKEKTNLTFLMVFNNLLSKYLASKIISCIQWLLCVVFQNKKGVWNQLLMHIFCMIFPWKCSFFNTLLMNKVSMLYLSYFSRHQTKCVIKFLLRQVMTS